MANRGRNGLEVIAGQLESWVICEFEGDKIVKVRWSMLAPDWAKDIAIEVLGEKLEEVPLIISKLFSQVVDDIDHVANTVCGDPVSVDELCDQIRPGFHYPDKVSELIVWMQTGAPLNFMNQVLSNQELSPNNLVDSVATLLTRAIEILADDMIHDVSAAVARLVEQWEEDHAEDD